MLPRKSKVVNVQYMLLFKFKLRAVEKKLQQSENRTRNVNV